MSFLSSLNGLYIKTWYMLQIQENIDYYHAKKKVNKMILQKFSSVLLYLKIEKIMMHALCLIIYKCLVDNAIYAISGPRNALFEGYVEKNRTATHKFV